MIDGRRVNKSLGIRNESVPDQLLLQLELKAQTAPECIVKPTLEEACNRFLDQKKAQRISETSLAKYRLLLERRKEFARHAESR